MWVVEVLIGLACRKGGGGVDISSVPLYFFNCSLPFRFSRLVHYQNDQSAHLCLYLGFSEVLFYKIVISGFISIVQVKSCFTLALD